jgi:hypothetical protein
MEPDALRQRMARAARHLTRKYRSKSPWRRARVRKVSGTSNAADDGNEAPPDAERTQVLLTPIKRSPIGAERVRDEGRFTAVDGFDPAECGVLKQVRSELAPTVSSLRAELYALCRHSPARSKARGADQGLL